MIPLSPLCERFRYRIDDHPRHWIDHDRRPVLTYASYTDPVDPVLAAFHGFCAAHGLTVEIGERSPHMPGETLLLVVRPTR